MSSTGFNIDDYSDIEPLPLDVPNNATILNDDDKEEKDTGSDAELCRILYSDEYRLLMGIARALIEKNELSVRSLILTSKIIEMVPAFYTIWNFRYRVIENLLNQESKLTSVSTDSEGQNKDKFSALLNNELDWLDEVTLSNPKNYQIWSYRQALLKNLHPSPSMKRELPIISLMLDDDTKNYHVWSHRKWCCIFFNDYSNELTFTRAYIERDVYNNSAWNHRMFLFKKLKAQGEGVLNSAAANDELEFCMRKIEFVPQNVSSWNYLRGLLELFYPKDASDTTAIAHVLKFTEKFIANADFVNQGEEKWGPDLPEIESSYALEFYAYLKAKDPEGVPVAIAAYKALARKYDPIREHLWNHKIQLLTQ